MHSFIKALVAISFASTALANNALKLNPNTQNDKTAVLHITEWGSDFYFAICAVMTTTALGIIGVSYMKPRSDRIFFYLCAAICATAAVAYFSMGSNLGWTPIDVEWVRKGRWLNGKNREIFYVRYIDWYVLTFSMNQEYATSNDTSAGSSPHPYFSWTSCSPPASHGPPSSGPSSSISAWSLPG